MRLRGVDLGHVLGAAGVQSFHGEGYWFHKLYKLLFRMNLEDMTFVAKTATLLPRKGNTAHNGKLFLKYLFPSWARVRFFSGHILNAMGLPNEGLGVLLQEGKWQKRTKPFMISLASVGETTQRRLEELRIMVAILKLYKRDFCSPFGLQINLSCPNTGHNHDSLIGESEKALEIASVLKIPLMPKYSIASASIEAVMELNHNPFCDAICISNTLPFGWKGLDWKKVWGSETSPLAIFGGGGLSGKTLCPLVCEWIARLRDAGFTKPINGGGGIMCRKDVKSYYDAGASSVFLGSVATLRPWRVNSIIKYVNSLIWK